MTNQPVQKFWLPLGVVLLLVGTLFLVKCDIDHAERDPLGHPVHPQSRPPQSPLTPP